MQGILRNCYHHSGVNFLVKRHPEMVSFTYLISKEMRVRTRKVNDLAKVTELFRSQMGKLDPKIS